MTALVDPQQLGGNHLAYLPRYAAADDEAWNWSDHEVEAKFLAGLERMYPAFRREHVKAFKISRARHVMALPTLEYSHSLPPMATAAENVFAVNSAHIVKGTLNVNEVLTLADDAFERVLVPTIADCRSAADPLVPHAQATRESDLSIVAASESTC